MGRGVVPPARKAPRLPWIPGQARNDMRGRVSSREGLPPARSGAGIRLFFMSFPRKRESRGEEWGTPGEGGPLPPLDSGSEAGMT